MAPALSDSIHLIPRASDPSNPPLASIFALIINRAKALSSRAVYAVSGSIATRSTCRSTAPVVKLSIIKRQNQQQILVIPTTYAGLNDGPAPGAVVGIVLGAILGFLLVFMAVLLVFRALGYGGREEIIEEEVIRRHERSKKSSTVSPPPVMVESRRVSRMSRRESRRTSRREEPETVIVEEEMSEQISEAPEVIVEEEDEEDIVEVIEEHSPEPPPRRRKSGHYRTIDPAEYGGGDAPSRRISRNSRN